jgi:hypothetical protein
MFTLQESAAALHLFAVACWEAVNARGMRAKGKHSAAPGATP